ncbi:MAG: molybdopterin molybdotransferase MoeA [Beijerinckiaceae bacterium]|jgi:molybdopterin molybdotransferase|nr:molybdopterin molybdotransferase MoeA [Beijerinckiaceae bacterium]
MALMGVDAALAAMTRAVAPLASERVPLEACAGRVLASDVVARISQPPFDASAMDGWAVRAADGLGVRAIIGESAAGAPFRGMLQAGEAVRIFTGAAVPEGADHVVMQEDATRDGDSLAIAELAKANVRKAGIDFSEGGTLLASGQRLTGARPALIAAAGHGQVRVRHRPRIGLVPTGNELLPPGSDARPGAIYESVSHGLAALIGAWGGVAEARPAVPDRPDAITDAVAAAQRKSDLVVMIGGASVGDHDHARGVAAGGAMLVEKVAIRPGKPTWFATTPGGPILGLPGNPASALVCARLFLLPLIEALLGLIEAERANAFTVRLAHALPANGPRCHLRRAILAPDATGQFTATSQFDTDSSLLSPFASANGLIIQQPDTPALDAGAPIAGLIMVP